jgi:hypothetical protein
MSDLEVGNVYFQTLTNQSIDSKRRLNIEASSEIEGQIYFVISQLIDKVVVL